MNEEQLMTSMLESIMNSIRYYGDKGPNMEWKEEYGDSNNVFIAWQEEQWKNCLNAIDGLSNNGERIITYIRDLHEYIIDRNKIKQLENQLAEVNKKTEKYEAAQITAEKNVIDEIHALGRDFLNQQKLSTEAQKLEQELRTAQLHNSKLSDDNHNMHLHIKKLSDQLKKVNCKVEEKEVAQIKTDRERDCLRDELIRKQEACAEAQNRAEQLEEQLDNANRETAARNDAYAAKEEEYRTEIARLNALHEEKLKQVQNALNDRLSEIQEIRAQNEMLGKQLEETRLCSEEHVAECEAAEQQYAESLEIYGLYQPVLMALQSCAVFHPIVEKYLLEGSGVKPLFLLAQQIGVSIDFAKELYDMAKEAKKKEPETITDDERLVYESMNQCYRSLWKVDFDIYRQPGHQTISEKFQNVKYDTAESENLANSRDRNSKYAQEVYVPSLWARTGNVYLKALVKVGNL